MEDVMKGSGINRRNFIKYGMGGIAGLLVGSNLPSWSTKNNAYAATQSLNFTFTDALKNMVTHNSINRAQCYFWIFKSTSPNLAPDCPGPIIYAFEGDTITVNLKNTLPQAHRFAIPAAGKVSPTLGPGTLSSPTSASFTFTVDFPAGSYLYYDDLNEPVNRMMGLHGAFIVMPNPATGTPYSASDVSANPRMAQLFADLGTAPWWPGLAWHEGADNPEPYPATPDYRQYIWLLHEASPKLFAEVGKITGDFDATTFVNRFLNDPLVTRGKNKAPVLNNTPQYFTINGQSGHFSHNSPFICPNLRVGEPCVIRCLNAGLWTHSLHIHANHVYVLAENNKIEAFPGQRDNLIWVDTFTIHPLDTYDWLCPYMKPPDVPNTLGIGRADLSDPLPVKPDPISEFGVVMGTDGKLEAGNTPPGETTWPPVQELNMAIPKVGTTIGNSPAHVPLSPLCFPMHDHSEPSQTAQGGNYNLGLISGINFIGDRNADGRLPGGVLNFPHAPTIYGSDYHVSIQTAAGPKPPYPEIEGEHTMESVIAAYTASPDKVTLKKGESKEVIITLVAADGFPPPKWVELAGKVIKGRKIASVSPETGYTDDNGQLTLTITAKNKTGKAMVKCASKEYKDGVKIPVKVVE